MKKTFSFLLIIILSLSAFSPVFSYENTGDVGAAIERTGEYILNEVHSPKVSTQRGDWAVVGVARSGYDTPYYWYENYYNTVSEYTAAKKGVLSANVYTDYSRVILGLTATGYDPRNVSGYDLTLPLGDFNKTSAQGVNGPIFALIALDSNNYIIPENSAAETQATREMYVDEILKKQLSNGGFALSGDKTDPDVTAMAIQALTKYSASPEVSEAIDKALICLSSLQNGEGGFSSGPEGVSQAIIALCELKIPLDDTRFVKNGKNLLDNLLSYQTENGGFSRDKSDKIHQISTEQALIALAALKRSESGLPGVYDMADAFPEAEAVKIKISCQTDEKGFLISRGVFEIAPDLAEQYGYNDTFKGKKLSVLDAVVAAHIAVYGEDKTAVNEALKVNQTGFLSSFMNDGEGNMYYFINGEMYEKAAGEVELKGGDTVELYKLRDTVLYSDAYAWFKGDDGKKTEEIYVTKNTDFTINLQGTTFEGTAAVSGAKIVPLKQAIGGKADFGLPLAVTNENGNATLRFNTEGTYIISAVEGNTPISAPWLIIYVENDTSGGTGGGNTSENRDITVYFTLMGDYEHKNGGGNHTFAGGGLKTWLSQTSVTLPEGSTVWDVIKKAASGKAVVRSKGNYVDTVTYNGVTLSEFSNSPTSGWMYALNGKHPGLGIDEQTVRNGQDVVLHYTDDYTSEEDAQRWSGASVPEPSSTPTPTPEPTPKLDEEPSPPPAKEQKTEWSNPYGDVSESDWFYDAVKYTSENGLIKGTNVGFEPRASLTRGMLVTILYRLEREPESGETSYYDVKSGEWYSSAVAWARENGVINGYGNNIFGPNENITREQFAIILYNYANQKGIKTPSNTAFEEFSDREKISSWAKTEVSWAVGSGLLQGRGENTLAPDGTTARAEAAVLLMRFIERILEV